jgi:D-serine dehydratase
VGTVTTTHPFGGVFKNMSYEAALTEALKKAEQLGATHFVLDKNSEAHFLGYSETVRGNAYRAPGR